MTGNLIVDEGFPAIHNATLDRACFELSSRRCKSLISKEMHLLSYAGMAVSDTRLHQDPSSTHPTRSSGQRNSNDEWRKASDLPRIILDAGTDATALIQVQPPGRRGRLAAVVTA